MPDPTVSGILAWSRYTPIVAKSTGCLHVICTDLCDMRR